MRVLLADNHAQIRWALRTVIKEQPGLLLVGEVTRAEDLLSQVQTLKPDLILLDWELLGQEEEKVIADVHRVQPGAKVIILSRRPESQQLALDAGAEAFVSKAGAPDHLLTALRRLARAD
jgi:two-component system invasion response regulator UvrY